MKKILTIIYITIITVSLVLPINTHALNTETLSNNYVQILDETIDCTSKETGILGSVQDEESVAWLLQKILNYIKILGPSLAIALGTIDFVKAIVASDEKSMKETQKKFVNRLIAAFLLFFVPLIVQVLLNLFGFTTNIACGLK